MDFQSPLNPAALFSAQGLVVVITGGGSGIGLAIASALYQNGAHKVYLIGRRLNVLEDAIKNLEASPWAAPKTAFSVLVPLPRDVTDPSSVEAAASQIENETGYVDVLINNAGILGPCNASDMHGATSISELKAAMLQGMDTNEWDATLKINTQAVVGVSATFLPLLEAANTRRGWAAGKVTGDGIRRGRDTSHLPADVGVDDDRLAHIITVASIASFMRHCASGLAYNASKAAAMQLGKIMATFLSEWGVRSNVVCPGPYPSSMTTHLDGVFGTRQLPQGRMGGIDGVAGLFLFLVGKGGAYVNGSVQLTEGGRLAVWPGTY